MLRACGIVCNAACCLLCRLHVLAPSFPGPLPAILPGAFQQLQALHLTASAVTTLPASWGSQPAVLPALQKLSLRLHLVGPLPAAWSGGFGRLQSLSVLTVDVAGSPAEASWFEAAGRGNLKTTALSLRILPSEWAAGFPVLRYLELEGLHIAGPFPTSWSAHSSFPTISSMSLHDNHLTGSLPEEVFKNHPSLIIFKLDNNRFSGSLPQDWVPNRVQTILLHKNLLTGLAFPPAWAMPGALPSLMLLDISDNSGLAGTLPADLSWPSLKYLYLGGTSVYGTVPQEWCSKTFRAKLHAL